MDKPTQSRLHELFDYEPETGIVTRLVAVCNRVKVGDVVSCHAHGYMQVGVDCRRYLLHRIIWMYVHGEWPDSIDHINGIKNDNRISNLRSVSQQENCKNAKIPSNNTSGVVGVSWSKAGGKWSAQIMVDGKNKHLGYFTDKEDAIEARQMSEIELGYHPNHGRA